MEKELEHLRRRNESLKAEFEQEKQVFPVFPLQLLYHPPFVSRSQEKFASKVCDVHIYHMKSLNSFSQCEVNDLQQQLSQQADYCTSMGAACCTLLWRVSRQEDSIHSILSGVHTVTHTLSLSC